MGHMFEQAEIDILIRWRRMTGRRALWVPGVSNLGDYGRWDFVEFSDVSGIVHGSTSVAVETQ